jgi:subtilisin family serine protease
MRFTFTLRGKPVSLTRLDDVVAVRPTADVAVAKPSRAAVLKQFGTVQAPDDADAGTAFGLDLPARNRRLFERAGWLFGAARENLSRAAVTRTNVPGADAVRPVFIDRGGNTLIGTGLVTVQLPPDLTEARAQARVQAHKLVPIRRLRFAPNLFEARLRAGVPFTDAVVEMQAVPEFVFAEPALVGVLTGRRTPTDPRYGDQWQHKNTGANGGSAGADIRSEAAWDRTRGAGVRVAVIDNGMQIDHPDLAAGVVGGGHFESDNTGRTTFTRFQAGNPFPGGDHGTFCLGMAGARMDNGKGGCGSAPEAELIAIGCLSDQVGTQTTLARAVAYAADPTTEDPTAGAGSGAHVLACSLGPNGADWDLTSVLDLALRTAAAAGRGGLGLPIFWAVSNGTVEVSRDEICSHPDVIAVGRSNRLDLADGSAYGPKLEFLAPGAEVFSTKQGNRYGVDTGTSFACPLAAGVAALVLARHPTWTRDELLQRLRETCDKIGGVPYAAGRHDEYGFGRLNADAATR